MNQSIDQTIENNENLINELNSNINDFGNDLSQMKDILDKLNHWIDNGISSLSSAIDPLTNQIQYWEQLMENLLSDFKNNLIELKKQMIESLIQ